METSLTEDLPDSEIVITSFQQKRGALIALKALSFEVERTDISFEDYVDCQEKMVTLMAELERFNESNRPRLVEVSNG